MLAPSPRPSNAGADRARAHRSTRHHLPTPEAAPHLPESPRSLAACRARSIDQHFAEPSLAVRQLVRRSRDETGMRRTSAFEAGNVERALMITRSRGCSACGARAFFGFRLDRADGRTSQPNVPPQNSASAANQRAAPHALHRRTSTTRVSSAQLNPSCFVSVHCSSRDRSVRRARRRICARVMCAERTSVRTWVRERTSSTPSRGRRALRARHQSTMETTTASEPLNRTSDAGGRTRAEVQVRGGARLSRGSTSFAEVAEHEAIASACRDDRMGSCSVAAACSTPYPLLHRTNRHSECRKSPAQSAARSVHSARATTAAAGG